MFSVVYVCSQREITTCDALDLPQVTLPYTNHSRPLPTWGQTPGLGCALMGTSWPYPPPDLFKLDHYVEHTSTGTLAVSLQLNGFLYVH